MNGWAYPVSRGDILAMDRYDLMAARYMRRDAFRPYPRPWAKPTRIGSRKKRTVAQVMARLRPHKAATPTS